MSILEKFFKNKKGDSEGTEEKPIRPRIVQYKPVIVHARAILSGGKMYDTSKATELIEIKEDVCFSLEETFYRVYLVTENGRYFSSRKTMGYRKECKPLENLEEYRRWIRYSDLRIESESAVKVVVGKTNIELYKQLFGEVDEA